MNAKTDTLDVNTLKTIAGGAVMVALTVGFVWWRLHAEAAPPSRVEILGDPSGSQQRNCNVERALAEKGLEVLGTASGAWMRVFMTGGVTTANEPLRLDIPSPQVAPSSVLADRSHVATDRIDYLDRVRDACAQAHATTVSPIYLALKRLVEDAADRNTPGRFKGYVFAHSDLQETEVVEIKRALKQRVHSPMHGLPPAIDNTYVDVYVCGYSETIGVSHGRVLTGARQPDSSDRLIEVWKRLFTRPTAVRIEAYCDGDGSGAAARIRAAKGN